MATSRLLPSRCGFPTPGFLLSGAVALLVATAAVAAPSRVRISEFQADNADTIKDEDGDTPDWIELYNAGPTPTVLAGYTLTDDPTGATGWTMPAVTLEPGGVLLVWASGKDRRDPAKPLHTDFALAAQGGYLALRSEEGVLLTEFSAYPDQPEDRSYGSGSAPAAAQILVAGAPCRWLVPTGPLDEWAMPDFDDSGWTAAVTGIGYDRSTASVNYLPLLGADGNVESAVYQKSGTCYVRIPFTVGNPGNVVSLSLRMKFDDGFAAFLNGERLNPPDSVTTNAPEPLAWNSLASATRSDSAAIIFATYDISSQRTLLRTGQNVLAVQAMNSALNSSDLLMVPQLDSVQINPAAVPYTGFFPVPTPGLVNQTVPFDGFTDAPDFSVKRGYYSEPQAVTLSTKTEGAEIRYTLNGNTPTETLGTLYTGPLTISSSVVLRARAFRPDWAPSTVKSHSYLFAAQVRNQPAVPAGFPSTWGYNYSFTTGSLNPNSPAAADYRMAPQVTGAADYSALVEPALTQTLPVVSLATDIPGLFGLNGIYSNGRLTDGLEVPVSMEYFTPGNGDVWQEDAGLRIHGGDAPLEHPKKPFRVYFRKTYGKRNLEFPLYPDSPVTKFDVLQLRGGGHDGWAVPFGSTDQDLAWHATYLRDRFLRQTELDMGRLSPRGRYVHLYLNGLYWGLYDLHEVPNKDYFADHLGGQQEDWDVVQNPRTSSEDFGMVDGTPDAMEELLALCRPASRLTDSAVYREVQRYLDLDAFADHLIVQMWGAQNDWMGPVFRGTGNTDASRFFNKNWDTGRRSRGAGEPSPFYFNVWDAEISMGSHLSNLVSTMRVTNFDHTRIGTPVTEIPRAAGTPGPPAEIYYALRQNAAFRMRMADRLEKHFFHGGMMTKERNQARLDALSAQLDLPIVAESARWGDVNSGNPTVVTFTRNVHWRGEVNWLRETYMGVRNETLLGQFRSIGIWPAARAPEVSPEAGAYPGGVLIKLRNVNPAGGEIYYTLDGSDPMEFPHAETVALTTGASPCQWMIPSAQLPGNTWKSQEDPADLAAWNTGTAALGYDDDGAFTPFIATSLEAMRGVNSSVYVRIPFTVTPAQKAAMTSLTLNMRYDDGAYVFLNGSVPLLRLNAPASSPYFQDVATDVRTDAVSAGIQSFDLSAYIPLLSTDRQNVLAIQGLNASADNGDFLLVPELRFAGGTDPRPSPSSIRFTGGLRVTESVQVKARVLLNGEWSPLLDEYFASAPPATAANLVISEFCYHPEVTDAEAAAGYSPGQFEFIELTNVSGLAISLEGLQFTGGVRFDFSGAGAGLLDPGGRVVLAADAAALATRFPGVVVAGEFGEETSLSNAGERLTLLDAAGIPVFDFTYDDVAPWPEAADTDGYSLVLLRPETLPDPSLPENWRASLEPGGNPGSADADTFAAWALRNEVTGGLSGDQNGNGVSNLLEYAAGTAAPPVLEAVLEEEGSARWLRVSWLRNRTAEDVSLILRMSDDLLHWTPVEARVMAVESARTGVDRVTVRFPVTGDGSGRLFVQLAAGPLAP